LRKAFLVISHNGVKFLFFRCSWSSRRLWVFYAHFIFFSFSVNFLFSLAFAQPRFDSTFGSLILVTMAINLELKQKQFGHSH